MVRPALRARRALRLLPAAGVACALLVGCGGSDAKVKSFTLDVEPSDTVNTLFQRGLAKAVDLCTVNAGLLQVKWSFDGEDVDKPVVQDYTSKQPKYPTYITCDAVKGDLQDGNAVTTLTSAADEAVPDDQDVSSQDQDEGGKGAESSSTSGAGGAGGTAGTTATSRP
jgi:hypothetical protein